MQENELLTVKKVATYLRVSRVTVWRWCQRGIIPGYRLGRNWRIRRDDLLALLESPVCFPSANSKTAVAPKCEENAQTTDEDSEEIPGPDIERD